MIVKIGSWVEKERRKEGGSVVGWDRGKWQRMEEEGEGGHACTNGGQQRARKKGGGRRGGRATGEEVKDLCCLLPLL